MTRNIMNPVTYINYLKGLRNIKKLLSSPNYRGIKDYPPGHYYSPLLDIERLESKGSHVGSDGEENWKYLDLHEDEQRKFYANMLANSGQIPFPTEAAKPFRYFRDNAWFVFSDALTLSTLIQCERPKRIVEVGSGFSSAVILDTLQQAQLSTELTFIEPFPERLYSLLTDQDRTTTRILESPVQEVSFEVFDQLESQDILFIDSSHVAKVGSDVAFLFLQVLPRLKPGVLVHFHDIFYPYSYPLEWIKAGRAWNESLFLRAFLLGNPKFQIFAFTSYAGQAFPELFRELCPEFLRTLGGSIWLKVVES